MIRVALVAYLMVATLAGPAWCCCTLERLAVLTKPTEASKTTDATEAPGGCCCHQQAVPVAKEQSASKKPEKKSVPREEGCPCKKHSASQVSAVTLALADSSQGWRDLFDLPRLPVADIAVDSGLQVAGPSLGDLNLAAPGSPMTGRDILRAFQIFLC
ncbi:MAG: hypothetical protein HY040_22505 [Planctomycetes bacterium]|nr:hypothetical protein [Planctomycetota bacterium]